MKSFLLLTATVIISVSAIAQPVLTAALNNPLAGEAFKGNYCETAGVHTGAAGAGAMWDFSTLTATDFDTTTYFTCTGITPPCSDFPGTTLVTGDTSDYTYYIADTGKLAVNGAYDPDLGNLTAGDPLNIISYPFTYNTPVTDSFSFTGAAGAFTYSGIDSFMGDGYGTLVLPAGTFTNVLRIHEIMKSSTRAAIGTPTYQRSETYLWFTPGFHSPLLTITVDTSGGDTIVSSVSYYTHVHTTGVNGPAATPAGLTVYPNPAADELHMQLSGTGNMKAAFTLMDMAGRVVAEKEATGNGAAEAAFSVAALPAQLYMVRVQSGSTTLVRKVQVTR